MDNWVSDTLLNEKENEKLLKYCIKVTLTRIAIKHKMSQVYLKNLIKRLKLFIILLIKKISNFNKKKIVTYISSVYKSTQIYSLVKIHMQSLLNIDKI